MADKTEKTWTILELLRWGTDYFEKKGIDSPRLTFELLLCEVLKIDRIEIYTQFDKPLTKDELATLKAMLLRRTKHEPLQYIFGKSWFCGVEFIVNPQVLIPRPESELLVEQVNKSFEDKSAMLQILDIGTGSGCLAISVAKNFPNSQVLAIDITEKIIDVAKRNVIKLRIPNVKFEIASIFQKKNFKTRYDVIISNPPYIEFDEYKKLQPEVLKFEPQYALTDKADGLSFYRYYSQLFKQILAPNGKFFLEFGFGQKEKLIEIFDSKVYDIDFINDFADIPRIISGKLKS